MEICHRAERSAPPTPLASRMYHRLPSRLTLLIPLLLACASASEGEEAAPSPHWSASRLPLEVVLVILGVLLFLQYRMGQKKFQKRLKKEVRRRQKSVKAA